MTYIQTFSGQHFDLIDPQPETIRIEDIAHALSQINRFTGHTKRPYSVAQHSLQASYIVPEKFALKSLLPDYRAFEDRIEAAVRRRFGLPAAMSSEVKRADLIMLATERRDVLKDDGAHWPILDGISPRGSLIYDGWGPAAVRSAFIQRFVGLYYGD